MLGSSNTPKRLGLIQNSMNLIKASNVLGAQAEVLVSNLVKTRVATQKRLQISKGLIFQHSQTSGYRLDTLVLAPGEEVAIGPDEALVAL